MAKKDKLKKAITNFVPNTAVGELPTKQEEDTFPAMEEIRPELNQEAYGITFNPTTKQWQVVHINYELTTGTAKVTKVGFSHTNKIMVQQEVARIMINTLMGVKK